MPAIAEFPAYPGSFEPDVYKNILHESWRLFTEVTSFFSFTSINRVIIFFLFCSEISNRANFFFFAAPGTFRIMMHKFFVSKFRFVNPTITKSTTVQPRVGRNSSPTQLVGRSNIFSICSHHYSANQFSVTWVGCACRIPGNSEFMILHDTVTQYFAACFLKEHGGILYS